MKDVISRQAVRLIESDPDAYPQEWNDDYEKGFADALNKVITLPSAQPERKKGEWVEYSSNYGTAFRCSICGLTTLGAKQYDLYGNEYVYEFCPHCGADMRGNDG